MLVVGVEAQCFPPAQDRLLSRAGTEADRAGDEVCVGVLRIQPQRFAGQVSSLDDLAVEEQRLREGGGGIRAVGREFSGPSSRRTAWAGLPAPMQVRASCT